MFELLIKKSLFLKKIVSESKVYRGNDMEEKLKKYSRMLEQTFEWGCNDTAKVLYANAIYSVISDNKNFEECEQDYLDYMNENGIR